MHMEDQNSCKPSVFRNDSFLMNLEKLYESAKATEIIKRFHSRHLEIEKSDVSYRVLTHWDSLDLIECERDSSQGWRRFNLIETLWLSVIKKSRELGLSLEQLAKAKSSFFQKISSDSSIDFADYYLIGAIFMKFPTFFIIFPDGHGEFLFYEEVDLNLSMGAIESHISIFLNPLLNRILRKKIEWSFPLQQAASVKQATIIDLMNSEEFNYLNILKKKNEITDVKIIKDFPGTATDRELQEGYDNVSIENHYENGGVKTKKRTIHKKL